MSAETRTEQDIRERPQVCRIIGKEGALYVTASMQTVPESELPNMVNALFDDVKAGNYGQAAIQDVLTVEFLSPYKTWNQKSIWLA